MSEKRSSPFMLSVTAIFTALVCVVTMSFSIYVPATRGFFNIGDSMVFLSALLFGPLVGAFASGVGSGLADLLLGYFYYAPATLVIKGFEGFIVGELNKRKPSFSVGSWRIYTLTLGLIIGGLLGYFGINYYSGDVEVALGSSYFTLNIPQTLWAVLSVLVVASITYLAWKHDPEMGWTIFTVTVGGLAMVTGYFIYQYFLIGPLFQIEVVAIAEVPINVGQMIVGIVISLLLVKPIKKYLSFL
jgi:uncharacterized membrane protein